MHNLMDGVFARYGMDGVITSAAESRKVKLFFHAVNSRSWQNMERMFSPLGEIPRGQYLCLLPASAAVAAGDTVAVNGGEYRFCRVEPMATSEGTVYHWSLCVEKGGVDDWAVSE